jgi:serine/threonine protein phosphatase PrpC
MKNRFPFYGLPVFLFELIHVPSQAKPSINPTGRPPHTHEFLPPAPDCNTIKLGQHDMLLLCSDGLTDMLSDSEIEAVLANNSTSFESLPGELIDAANEKGGHDNISIILIRCDK